MVKSTTASLLLLPSLFTTAAFESLACKNIRQCDLRAVQVPAGVAWDLTGATGEFSTPAEVSNYWSRVRTMEDKMGLGQHGLHALCGVEQSPTAKLAKLLFARSSEGRKEGLLLLWAGDSFMRINFVQFIRSVVAADSSIHEKLAYNKSRYHLDHAVCCAKGHGDALLRDCHAFLEQPASTGMLDTMQQSVNEGMVCAMWKLANHFPETTVLLRGLSDRDLEPDLLVANGGLHYGCGPEEPGGPFQIDLGQVLNVSASLMMQTMRHMKRVFVGSTTNPWCFSEKLHKKIIITEGNQRERYAAMRRLVGANVEPSVDARTFFISLDDLADMDDCGYTHRFPARQYAAIGELGEQDSCGNAMHAMNPHLNGGAYIHLAELELGWAVECGGG